MEEGLALVVERKGKKRKRKKMREDRGRPFCQDPLDGLGRDLMLRVLNNFDARSLALCLVVSRTWNRVASSDLLWTSKPKTCLKIEIVKMTRGGAIQLHDLLHKEWCLSSLKL
ncbi:hypothetical protein POPTR_010G061000v4 [Populus trichocarpa]|uniref:F-box domain-containing protein n=1 Tax=Populus trichocarpa TaxID=3694 RepID=A0A3N7FR35_POPTR|nr:hypothetical protein POPTR_010G061000v4 [Populus trichocarpa]